MKRNVVASAILALGLSWAGGAPAPAQGIQAKEPVADPQAFAILRDCLNRVKEAKAYTVVVRLNMRGEMGGQKRASTDAKFVALERPNRLAILPHEAPRSATLVCDGKRLYASVPEVIRYVDDDAPATLDELARRMDTRIVANRLFLLDALVSNDPYVFAMANVTGVREAGEEEVGGAICRRLHVTQPGMEWDVWIEKGNDPVIRKISPGIADRLNMRAQAMGRKNPMKLSVEVFYEDWDFAPTMNEEWFEFKPPRGGEKAAEFIDLSRFGGRRSPLLGKPAPDFSLPLLNGGRMTLSEHTGKNVVILNFWVSYSAPCADMLPLAVKLAREFRDKGVVLYSVNQGDTLDDIRRFTGTLGLDCAVALDTDNVATQLYDAQTIPRTVIIGKDGVIQAVHAGFHPLLEEGMRQELETLASGGRLMEAGKEEPDAANKNANIPSKQAD